MGWEGTGVGVRGWPSHSEPAVARGEPRRTSTPHPPRNIAHGAGVNPWPPAWPHCRHLGNGQSLMIAHARVPVLGSKSWGTVHPAPLAGERRAKGTPAPGGGGSPGDNSSGEPTGSRGVGFGVCVHMRVCACVFGWRVWVGGTQLDSPFVRTEGGHDHGGHDKWETGKCTTPPAAGEVM